MDICFSVICFVQLDQNAPKFFGFSEYLASLALMVLAWTNSDIRYKFRIQTAPLPLQSITFTSVCIVGVLALLTDLWRAQQWFVPKGTILTPAIWQALLGIVFLVTFLVWAWYAFICPPVFSRRNAERFARSIYEAVLKANPTELAVIADELGRSARALVSYAPTHSEYESLREQADLDSSSSELRAKFIASDVLLFIADRRLCKAIVGSSISTAFNFFDEIDHQEKFDIGIGFFAKNMVSEALLFNDSFVYHETSIHSSGLIGSMKPLTRVLFSNFKMVSSLDLVLDQDYKERRAWNHQQWEAYCRVLLVAFRGCTEKNMWNNASVLFRAKGYLEDYLSYRVSFGEESQDDSLDPLYQPINLIVDFITNAVEILNDSEGHESQYSDEATLSPYYYLSTLIFNLIFHASSVRTPRNRCWSLQHNVVWSGIFESHHFGSNAGRIISSRVSRMLHNEIIRMEGFANFKGARILGFCLNVMGLRGDSDFVSNEFKDLHIFVLEWAQRNFVWLHTDYPEIAATCLCDGMSFDSSTLRLVKTYLQTGRQRQTTQVSLQLEPFVSVAVELPTAEAHELDRPGEA